MCDGAWRAGDLVMSLSEIVADGILHAESGSSGVVVYVDSDGTPTVRFYSTGRATIVSDDEVQKVGRLDCIECGEYCPEQYMVQDSLWWRAVPDGKGILHMKCLEKHIGRKLRLADLKEGVPLNAMLLFCFKRGIEEGRTTEGEPNG